MHDIEDLLSQITERCVNRYINIKKTMSRWNTAYQSKNILPPVLKVISGTFNGYGQPTFIINISENEISEEVLLKNRRDELYLLLSGVISATDSYMQNGVGENQRIESTNSSNYYFKIRYLGDIKKLRSDSQNIVGTVGLNAPEQDFMLFTLFKIPERPESIIESPLPDDNRYMDFITNSIQDILTSSDFSGFVELMGYEGEQPPSPPQSLQNIFLDNLIPTGNYFYSLVFGKICKTINL